MYFSFISFKNKKNIMSNFKMFNSTNICMDNDPEYKKNMKLFLLHHCDITVFNNMPTQLTHPTMI
jgi:hypothetical protein